MEVVIVFAVILLLVGVKIVYEAINEKKRLLYKLRSEYGKVPNKEYTSEKFEGLRYYYDTIKDENLDVDNITWNDIDMDEIYMLMNNTSCSIGEEYLYAKLRKLQYDNSKLDSFDTLVDYFSTHDKEREELQFLLLQMGITNKISIFEYINRLKQVKEENIAIHVFQAVGFLSSILFILVNPMIGGTLTVGFLAWNITTYYKAKAKFDKYLAVVKYISSMLKQAKKISQLDNEAIRPIVDVMKQESKSLASFNAGMSAICESTGSMLDMLFDYIRILFHLDIIVFYRALDLFVRNESSLIKLFECYGELDSAIAVASFREMLPYYAKPCFSSNKKDIKISNLYHPLISDPVVNSIEENQSVLITGSNASGKSTFIKTVAINAILAQTIYTALCDEYEASYFIVISSMALRDDIASMESYYIVEIKSLKRMMDRLRDDIPVLCFVDEVLRGTNTLERIAASSQILASLSQANALCFAATHDIELTHILEEQFSNYHFQEQIVDNTIIFDYKLYEGRAISRNAIKLLSILGYSESIIEKATKSANAFLETGEWQKLEF